MAGLERDPFLPTRRSLITRLKNWDDQESWQEFFQTYWKLIYNVAIKSGLTDTEAEDVVQETVLTVAKTMPGFRYEPERCRFKTWLMRLTRLRIVDQFRRRKSALPTHVPRVAETEGTGTVERIEDSSPPALETLWDEEWQKNLVDVAMERVKARVKALHYQIFYLGVVKDLSTVRVANTLGVSAAQVYLVKHRVAALVKKEVQKLEQIADQQISEASKRMQLVPTLDRGDGETG